MLDFCTGECQLTTRIDGVDRDFLFGNAQFPCLHAGGEVLTPMCHMLSIPKLGNTKRPLNNRRRNAGKNDTKKTYRVSNEGRMVK